MIDWTKKTSIDISSLLYEYRIDTTIFSEMDDRLINIAPKYNELCYCDKVLLILYADTGSYRGVGKLLGISHNTIGVYIREIKKKLLC